MTTPQAPGQPAAIAPAAPPKSRPDFLPLADYGIIGNCHTAALVSRAGSIDWLCLPRFDSPSLFARILDLDQGGFWAIQPSLPCTSEHRYIDHTNVLETTLRCATGSVTLLDFMEIVNSEEISYPQAPGRLIRMVEGVEGAVEMVCTCAPRPGYGGLPAFDIVGPVAEFDGFRVVAPTDWRVNTADHTLITQFTLRPGDRLCFALEMEDSPLPHDSPAAALDGAIAFWQNWANQCTYHGPYREAVLRSAMVLKLMSYSPTGAIVAAPTTSLPEVIGGDRNWDYRFTWIRDASFTLYALLMAGYFNDHHPFFTWLANTAQLEGTDTRILYPITAEGQVVEKTLDQFQGYRDSHPVRIGNKAVSQVQLDVYGEVLSALHFAWKTDKYDPTEIWDDIRPMLDWLASHWHHSDHGIWEVRGGQRNFVYSKVMAWVALDAGVDMASNLSLAGDVARWQEARDAIRAEVLEKGWSEKLGAFKQSYEDEVLDAANLLLPAMGFIDGTDPRMVSTVDATIAGLVTNGLCYRYHTAPEGLHGQEGAFVLCTFWLINALILAGRTDEACAWFEQMLDRSTPLGLFAEEIDPHSGQHLGNFPQAFSHLGVINVAVSLAHVGHTGSVDSHHRAAADAAGRGGGGAKKRQGEQQ
ncbi:glycoside hydrolase family 15 protein [Nodosilinea nodulosa]|uniref:glycoside hydrolase family 15 protein n=1 Tax=Nodosilinea nodulosa TaxID=416001 RepID=UPI0002E3E184|nr:glycoside hydrolase family 15 protein [Nodosilinea nodulosa]